MKPRAISLAGRTTRGAERFLLNPVFHEVASAVTKWTGVRDRLRCPVCRAVGTFKMHGSLFDQWRWKDRKARRWICKWCGYYIGPEGARLAWPSAITGAWQIRDLVEDPRDEPRPVPADYMPMSASKPGRRVNPWKG